jgi:uncharacterized phage protein (TIGR02220 family)
MRTFSRVVNTKFWSDEKVEDFSPEDKYFMLFLLTNEYSSLIGVYYLPLKKASVDLGYNIDSIKVLLDRFENKYDIIRYSKETNEVAIKNYLLYSIVSGGKPVLDCLIRETGEIKDFGLLDYIYQNLCSKDVKNDTVRRYVEHLGNFLKERTKENNSFNEYVYGNGNGSIVNESYNESSTNRTTNRSDNKETCKEVIEYLNLKAEKKFNWKSKQAQKYINARLNEGYSIDDFKKVIDTKVAEWKNDEKMNRYLQPSTLFAPSHFDEYLNQKTKKQMTDQKASAADKALEEFLKAKV